MSIASEAKNTKNYLRQVYDKIEEKGGELPDKLNMANLPDAILSITSGPAITPTGYTGAWARLTLKGGAQVEVASQTELNSLLASTTTATVGSQSISVANITAIEFGTSVTAIPNNSVKLDAWSSLKTIGGFHSGLKTIGDYCFTMSNGGSWGGLKNNTIVLPDTVTSVGALFLCACGDPNLRVVVNCPSTVFTSTSNAAAMANYLLAAYEVNSPQYVNGVKISGTNASDFIGRFLNSDRAPYRKLVNVTSLEDLKTVLEKGIGPDVYPAGAELPDTWNGNSNPLIVAQYLHSGNNSSYGGAEGVILIRKYVEPTEYEWGDKTGYNGSIVKDFIDTTYLENCSEALKSAISDISIPRYSSSNGMNYLQVKWFLMSAYEVCNQGIADPAGNEGIMWDYWKRKTGLSTPDDFDEANNGRIMRDRNGTAQNVWLRSQFYGSIVGFVHTSGSVDGYAPSGHQNGVLPACFIPGIVPEPPLPPSIDISKVLDKDTLYDIQRVVKAGRASEYFNLGDELKVKYSSYTMPFEIVGFEDVEVEGGETKHAINLLAKYTSETTTAWGGSGSTKYSASTLRTHCTSTYQGKLNSDFVSCLANTRVQTYSRDGSTDVVYDKVFAPSMSQLGVTDTVYNTTQQDATEGPAFAAYKGATNSKRKKQAIDATNTAQNYWTRSVYSADSSGFGLISASGATTRGSYSGSYRVVVACNLVGD